MPRLRLAADLRALAARDADVATELARIGVPASRARPPGFATLLRIVVGQQVSTKAAAAMWARLEAGLGGRVEPRGIAALDEEAMRGFGFSRQKAAYARDMAARLLDGRLDLDRIGRLRDGAAIDALVEVKGVGVWTAEVYLLFALQRGDVFPAGDLALQVGYQRLKRLRHRPDADRLRRLVAGWAPYRGAGAHLLWHHYANPPLA